MYCVTMDNAYSASTPSNWVTLYVFIFTFGILLLYITLFWLNLVFEEKLSLANCVGVSLSIIPPWVTLTSSSFDNQPYERSRLEVSRRN